MQIAIVNNDSVVKVGNYRQLFPYTVFPDSGPSDGWLIDNDCMKVNLFKPHDAETEILVPCAPYIESDWVYTVMVRNKTPEELQADVDARAAQKRAERDRALSASDWTQLADAPVDKAAWATYRQELRDLPQQPGFPDVDMPHSPDWVEPTIGA